MKRLLRIGVGIGVGIGTGMGIGESRRVRFDAFVDYIQKNYRMHLNGKDYEFLEEIAENFFAEEIMLAIEYCKNKKSDSLIYLRDALSNQYYREQKKNKKEPKWFNQELILQEKIDESDYKYFKNFYKKYCSSDEEANKKIEELELKQRNENM